jgi:predicted nucleic-acid-binding protein
VIALPAIAANDERMIREAAVLYAPRRMDWTDAYLVASAQAPGVTEVVSFDRSTPS